MEVYTIGFTKRSAADFFGAIRLAGVKRLLDVRLNNVSQLAGFSKQDDLKFFLAELCGVEYEHQPLLAPTQELLDSYRKPKAKKLNGTKQNGRKPKGIWADYERGFLDLMREREIEKTIRADEFREPTVLLCSEHTAEHCHRRLVLEYLKEQGWDISIAHL